MIPANNEALRQGHTVLAKLVCSGTGYKKEKELKGKSHDYGCIPEHEINQLSSGNDEQLNIKHFLVYDQTMTTMCKGAHAYPMPREVSFAVSRISSTDIFTSLMCSKLYRVEPSHHSVTMQKLGAIVHAPMKRMMFSCRHFLLRYGPEGL